MKTYHSLFDVFFELRLQIIFFLFFFKISPFMHQDWSDTEPPAIQFEIIFFLN